MISRMPNSALAAAVVAVVVLTGLVMLAVRRWRRADQHAEGLRDAFVILAAEEGVAPRLRVAKPCRVWLPGWVCRILWAHPQAVAAAAAVTAIGFAATLAIGSSGREEAAPPPHPVPPPTNAPRSPAATTTVTVTTTVPAGVSPVASPRVRRVAVPPPRSSSAPPPAPSAGPPPTTTSTTSGEPARSGPGRGQPASTSATPDRGCASEAVVCLDVTEVLVTQSR